MKLWETIELCALHICAAAGMACMALKILDWYNPFMDFEGHGALLQWLLYAGVPVIAVIRTFRPQKRK